MFCFFLLNYSRVMQRSKHGPIESGQTTAASLEFYHLHPPSIP